MDARHPPAVTASLGRRLRPLNALMLLHTHNRLVRMWLASTRLRARVPQMGKLHFGVILGWSVVHAVVLWFILNQLAGAEASEAKGLDLYSCCCVVGYCLLPICLYSAASLLLPR